MFVGDHFLHLSDDLSDEVFAHIDELLIEFATLNQEHRHPDLIGSNVPDPCDSFLVALDLSEILRTLRLLLCKESVNSLLFLEKEQELVIDIDAL